MCRRSLILSVVVLAGCAQQANVEVEQEQPKPVSTDFKRLPSVLKVIPKTEEVVLYEGLPSDFWEPELREREASRKSTIRLHGYPFYDEPLALRPGDVEQVTALFCARGTFKHYRAQKPCGGYHPDYCVEWKTGAEVTRALICLECGEVKIFGPGAELHCDLIPEAGERLARCLKPYQKNRPPAASAG